MSDDKVRAPTSATNTATTNGVSTSAIDVLGSSGTPTWFNFSIKGADVHILFGPTGSLTAATTSNALYLPAGIVIPFYIDDNTRYFRAIATSAVTGQCVSWSPA